MPDIGVSDYTIFDNAIETTNTLSTKINVASNTSNKCKNALNNESVFMGPICEECVNAFGNISDKIKSLDTNYSEFKNFYNDTKNNYKTGDTKASKQYQTAETTSSGNSKESETMIDRAMGVIGSPWVSSGYYWSGDPNSSYFTCSGLVDYALGRPTNTSSPESLRDEIGMENLTTDVSKLKRGDLVFYEYNTGHPDGWGHVGIYLGDNQIIDSAGEGVQIRDVNYMNLLGGGTLV